jgi:hypothetical protein
MGNIYISWNIFGYHPGDNFAIMFRMALVESSGAIAHLELPRRVPKKLNTRRCMCLMTLSGCVSGCYWCCMSCFVDLHPANIVPFMGVLAASSLIL